jgi:hypothetical protein
LPEETPFAQRKTVKKMIFVRTLMMHCVGDWWREDWLTISLTYIYAILLITCHKVSSGWGEANGRNRQREGKEGGIVKTRIDRCLKGLSKKLL